MNRSYLLRFFEAYYRHRWLNLLPLLLMLALGAGWLFYLSKPQYTAHGTMYVQRATLLSALTATQPNQSGWTTAADATTGEIKSLLQTDAFVRSVIKQSDLEPAMSQGPRTVDRTLSKVRSAVWVTSQGENLVQVGAIYTSPVIAQQLSADILQNYIQWRVNTDRSEGTTAQAYFEKLVPSYQAALGSARQDLQTFLAQHPDPISGDRPTAETIQINRLQATVADATTRLKDVEDKALNAQQASSIADVNAPETYRIIDTPEVPTQPATSRRQQALSIAAFVVVGLLLTLAAIIGAALFDSSLRFPEDVQQKLTLPLLAMVPEIREDRRAARARKAVLSQPIIGVEQALEAE
jgi:capsular polysaccharide biosynthesis protein